LTVRRNTEQYIHKSRVGSSWFTNRKSPTNALSTETESSDLGWSWTATNSI